MEHLFHPWHWVPVLQAAPFVMAAVLPVLSWWRARHPEEASRD